ncbi:sensor histidine kinase [Streptomyces fuscigenes]|uniref:sensor histidine kinase n=1 Tax=Streptomyces fuscigenes TaxID=1528880 RepID=UPI001F37618D|nr:sensor histidine kinase [Streptomyces fuscigenes]MCF3962129.1 sensor domain-containing protein [Streptomyces fuscigenes]
MASYPGVETSTEYGHGPGTAPRRHLVPSFVRAPFEARAWRELGHVVLSLPIGILMFVYSVTMLSFGAGMLVTFLGVPVLGITLASARGFAVMERARARRLLGLDVGRPQPLRPKKNGLLSWTGAVLRSGESWRNLLYTLLMLPWACFAFVVSVTFWVTGWGLLAFPLWRWAYPGNGDGVALYRDSSGTTVDLGAPVQSAVVCAMGLVVVLATPYVVRGLTSVDRLMVGLLLGPSRLESRVVELESDRGVVVDTAAADLRRIERDLHDGAQARLVALAMDLGLAKEKLAEDPEAAARMVDEAHGEVKTALQELRDLARGIHPAVLTDRGLDAALSSLAARCTVPVRVDVDLPGRPAPAIEGIAYFTVSELLQNISKHSRARRAEVDVWRSDGRLLLQVSDDGVGGADPGDGSGIAGLIERLGAVDGVLLVDSPQGGPTTVTAELPWRE